MKLESLNLSYNFQYNTITGGSYTPTKCRLEFYNFEAEDSGDWKVVVAINSLDRDEDEFTFTKVFATRQTDVRIEDPSTGDRDGREIRKSMKLPRPHLSFCRRKNEVQRSDKGLYEGAQI